MTLSNIPNKFNNINFSDQRQKLNTPMRVRQTQVISEATIRLEDMSHSFIELEEQEVPKNSKILIVDDESFNIRAINVLISSYGLNPDRICDKAKNG